LWSSSLCDFLHGVTSPLRSKYIHQRPALRYPLFSSLRAVVFNLSETAAR
jgi:hypothetical protein